MLSLFSNCLPSAIWLDALEAQGTSCKQWLNPSRGRWEQVNKKLGQKDYKYLKRKVIFRIFMKKTSLLKTFKFKYFWQSEVERANIFVIGDLEYHQSGLLVQHKCTSLVWEYCYNFHEERPSCAFCFGTLFRNVYTLLSIWNAKQAAYTIL